MDLAVDIFFFFCQPWTMNQRYDGLQKAYNIVKMETGSVCSYVRFTDISTICHC